MNSHFDIEVAEPAPEEEEEVTLDGTEAPREILKEVINTDTGEENPNFVYSDNEEEEEEELVDLPVKKPKLENHEVFSAPVVQEVLPEKKPKRKRKPMTPAQLEKLAEARKKAFATKARKKKERDELRDLQNKVKEKKKKKIKDEIVAELDDDELPESFKKAPAKQPVKEQQEPEPPPKQVTQVIQKSITPGMTPEQIALAVAQGVEAYDTKRKAQKKIKKQKEAQELKHKTDIRKISNALNFGSSPWDEFLK
tara:strand:- start:525 stop:1283 length:759 start_codon:yes stop_codon:yes gene_type:complete